MLHQEDFTNAEVSALMSQSDLGNVILKDKIYFVKALQLKNRY